MALYHTHRPQTFKDLKGQEHIRLVLLNAIKQGKTGHAYLFSGPRGLGKTTTARLLAKAINCLEGKGEPCNKCENCIKISQGKAFDVIEIDAASNRGIDEIRELRELVKFSPNELPKKIIIIDEVHMLTKEAFNALLKTLEEPPKDVVFILATTEPHKVETTILSRVQRFDFKRAQVDDITNHLQEIAKKEKINISKKAADLLATLAEGSYRDGVSLLDQIASSTQAEIDDKLVEKMLGIGDQETLSRFLKAIEKEDRQEAFRLLDDFTSNGGDAGHFLSRLIDLVRQKLRQSSTPEYPKYLASLLKAYEQIKISPFPLLPLELFVSQNTSTENSEISSKKESSKTDKQADTLLDKLDKPESKEEKDDDKQPQIPEAIKKKVSSGQTANLTDSDWLKIVDTLKQKNAPLAAVLQGSHLKDCDDGSLCIAVKFAFHKAKITDRKCQPLIEEEIEKLIGHPIIISCIVDKQFIQTKTKGDEQEETLVSDAMSVFGG